MNKKTFMILKAIFGLLLVALFCASFVSCSKEDNAETDNLPQFVKNEMELVWADEFDGESNEPDPKKWNYNVGGNGWGNSEVQNYTEDRENSFVSNGTLKIVAKRNANDRWTSARLVTSFRQAFTYGYIEFRAKLPVEQGSWPALWMLSQFESYGKWPRSGEIDVMEYATNFWGKKAYGTVHCKAGSGGNSVNSDYKEIADATKWHTYAIDWNEDALTWYYDGEEVTKYENPHNSDKSWEAWPFDKPFYIIMNVAMGGELGGEIPKKTKQCQMEVDYVRVYQKIAR